MAAVAVQHKSDSICSLQMTQLPSVKISGSGRFILMPPEVITVVGAPYGLIASAKSRSALVFSCLALVFSSRLLAGKSLSRLPM
jgi:hypothetical protein